MMKPCLLQDLLPTLRLSSTQPPFKTPSNTTLILFISNLKAIPNKCAQVKVKKKKNYSSVQWSLNFLQLTLGSINHDCDCSTI